MDSLQLINAILYVAANGCKWRALPKHYGNWHTIYTRMMRWSRSGVFDRIFEQLQRRRLMPVHIEAISLDSTIVKVHPDGTGAPKKNGPQSIGRSRGGWSTKVHRVAAFISRPCKTPASRIKTGFLGQGGPPNSPEKR